MILLFTFCVRSFHFHLTCSSDIFILFEQKVTVKKLVPFILFLLLLQACKPNDTELKRSYDYMLFKGSNSELELLTSIKEKYEENQDHNEIKIEGGGSQIGIDQFINNQLGIVNASRRLTAKEYNTAMSNGIENIVEVIFAMDALAIITHPRLGVDSLSIFQVGDIFEGNIRNWKTLGGPDHPINVYGRNSSSGTYGYLKDRLVHTSYVDGMVEFETPEDIVHAIKKDEYGIGYVDIGSVTLKGRKPDPGVWCINIFIEGGRAYSPFERMAVINGEYPLIRPFYHFINKSIVDIREAKDFIAFELSDEGQAIVEENGLYPITDIHKSMNKENGF